MDQTTSLIFFLSAVVLIGALIFAMICFGKKGAGHLNVEYYRTQYLKIENQLKRDEQSSYHLAVLNADKLVDQAMRQKGIHGQTMGDRMKSASKTFSDINGFWSAHKLRNKIAHEPDVYINYDEARQSLAQFKKALKDLGAI